MRHQVFGKKLGRNTNSRKHLQESLASSLLVNGNITTTLTKAKWMRAYVEKLIKKSQKNRLAAKRQLVPELTNAAFKKLIFEIGPGFTQRSGGYTRIIKLAPRGGDNAPMAKIELLVWDKSKTVVPPKSPKPKKVLKKVKVTSPKVQKENEKH